MTLRTTIILYWSIVAAFFIGVYIQDDETAKREAVNWLLIAISIFLIAVLIYFIRKKTKAE